MISKESGEGPEGEFLGFLRRAAVVAVVTGSAGSIALMLIVGHRNPSRILLALFAIWVLSPFVALALANLVSKRWSVVTRGTLHSMMLILTVGSLAIYVIVSSTRPAKPAFAFLIVPLVSWVLIATVIPIVALISGRKTPPGRRILKGLAVIAVLGVLAVAVLAGFLWKEQFKISSPLFPEIEVLE
jgi:hypothetical protein